MIKNNQLIIVQFSCSQDALAFAVKWVVARWGFGKVRAVTSNGILSTRCNLTQNNCIVTSTFNCSTKFVTSCVIISFWRVRSKVESIAKPLPCLSVDFPRIKSFLDNSTSSTLWIITQLCIVGEVTAQRCTVIMFFCASVKNKMVAVTFKSLCYHGVDNPDNCNNGRTWAFFLSPISLKFFGKVSVLFGLGIKLHNSSKPCIKKKRVVKLPFYKDFNRKFPVVCC